MWNHQLPFGLTGLGHIELTQELMLAMGEVYKSNQVGIMRTMEIKVKIIVGRSSKRKVWECACVRALA